MRGAAQSNGLRFFPFDNRQEAKTVDEAVVNELAEALRQRQAEIAAERAMNAEARDTVALDQASVGRVSRIDALQGQQMALAQDRNRAAELVQIEAALQRVADGSFGLCVVCDEDIPEKRLRLNPAAATCINCAK
ncbi:MAG: TraR/DksA C4-type zinc finger protein [Alphaproteobacteria bacterium]|nr:TraR/DksA C4-type zinc finger protein [Alphaproteobacteria bacterium]